MLDAQLFGMKAGGHHLMCLAIHLAAALALWAGMRRMTGSCWRAGAVAALFAIHPLHVESVAWAAERKDVLSGLFFFLAILAYGRYVACPGRKNYAMIVVWFLLGLCSKSMIVTLPLVLLLIDYWPLGRFAGNRPRPEGDPRPRTLPAAATFLVREKWPLFTLSLIFGFQAFASQRSGGALSGLGALTVGERLGNALIAYAVYLVKMVWPVNLAVH